MTAIAGGGMTGGIAIVGGTTAAALGAVAAPIAGIGRGATDVKSVAGKP
jgi:hypothetical protein